MVLLREWENFRVYHQPHWEAGPCSVTEWENGYAYFHELLFVPGVKDSAEKLLGVWRVWVGGVDFEAAGGGCGRGAYDSGGYQRGIDQEQAQEGEGGGGIVGDVEGESGNEGEKWGSDERGKWGWRGRRGGAREKGFGQRES